MKTTYLRNTLIGISVAVVSGLAVALSYPPQYAYMHNAPTYDNQYIPAYGQNDASYTYSTGCNTYRYNGYTRTTTLISSCTNYNTSYGYNQSYTQYVQPITQVSYVAPITHTYYVAPITTSHTVSPIYSYGYTNGYYDNSYNNWGYGYQDTPYYDGRRYHHTTDTWINNSYVDNYNGYTNTSNCYYSNGYQVCP